MRCPLELAYSVREKGFLVIASVQTDKFAVPDKGNRHGLANALGMVSAQNSLGLDF